MMKLLILSRGPSGSGKSFEIKKYVPKEQIFSTDDFWGPDYAFDPNKLHQAHQWNQTRTNKAMEQGISPIGVDNTNLTLKEMQPYIDMAKANEYSVKFIESTSPWWKDISSRYPFKAEDIEYGAQILNKRNQHNVPLETLKKMLQRWTPTEKLPIKESTIKTFKQYYLEEASAKPFLNFYYAQSRGLQPDENDVHECLYALEDYYVDYLKWYNDAPSRMREPAQKRIYRDFQKQLLSIKSALGSKDLNRMIIAVDQGINQWHHDYPVVVHFAMEVLSNIEDENEADAMEEEWYKVGDILKRLGRLPEKSPYKGN